MLLGWGSGRRSPDRRAWACAAGPWEPCHVADVAGGRPRRSAGQRSHLSHFPYARHWNEPHGYSTSLIQPPSQSGQHGAVGLKLGFWNPAFWLQIPALPLTSCVTWGKGPISLGLKCLQLICDTQITAPDITVVQCQEGRIHKEHLKTKSRVAGGEMGGRARVTWLMGIKEGHLDGMSIGCSRRLLNH